jgi:hypothetical protein
MKKVFLFSIFMAMAAVTSVNVNAQQISVVAPGGTTRLFTDLNTAISEAADGSTVYLSGGSFRISDEAKITKKLNIIGIGHKAGNDNADGNTFIVGNLFFEGGADASLVMGVYLNGTVHIGTAQTAVNSVQVRLCFITGSIQVRNADCMDTIINQNYIQGNSSGGNSNIKFTNNILFGIQTVNGGVIEHNIIAYYLGSYFNGNTSSSAPIINSQIKNNIYLRNNNIYTSNCIVTNNMYTTTFGDNCITVSNWDDVFEGPNNGINPSSNFALKGSEGKNAGTDGTDVGIYGGSGFSDTAMPPGPRIVSKRVAEQTDANGNLHVEIKVSAQ